MNRTLPEPITLLQTDRRKEKRHDLTTGDRSTYALNLTEYHPDTLIAIPEIYEIRAGGKEGERIPEPRISTQKLHYNTTLGNLESNLLVDIPSEISVQTFRQSLPRTNIGSLVSTLFPTKPTIIHQLQYNQVSEKDVLKSMEILRTVSDLIQLSPDSEVAVTEIMRPGEYDMTATFCAEQYTEVNDKLRNIDSFTATLNARRYF